MVQELQEVKVFSKPISSFNILWFLDRKEYSISNTESSYIDIKEEFPSEEKANASVTEILSMPPDLVCIIETANDGEIETLVKDIIFGIPVLKE